MNLSFCTICSYPVLTYIIKKTQHEREHFQYRHFKQNKFILDYAYIDASTFMFCLGYKVY